MSLRSHRTALALALTLLAVVFPCAAWFLVGSREVSHQVAEITDNVEQNARGTAQRLATQLTQRLNELREEEARRPFYHYQPYYHDPEGAAEGAAVVSSPLSAGPRDPLVQVYFQVDAETGKVTLPTADADLKQVDELQLRRARGDDQRFVQRQLEVGLNSISRDVRGESKQAPAAKSSSSSSSFGQRVEVLPKSAYAQNVDAADIYRSLRSAPQPTAPSPRVAQAAQEPGNVRIYVGPLKWRTVYVASRPSLVALREVTSPEGVVLQGFLLATSGIANFFQAAGMPARLLPGAPVSEFESALAIGDEPWRVIVDAGDATRVAGEKAAELRRSFWMIFLAGVAIATFSGIGLVWLVWQTERLARQRSQFAASAAHELRTPLAGLRLYSDMLAEGLGDPGKTHTYAQRVAAEAERLGRVVANVLGFTRLERGTLRVQAAAGDLAAAVRESAARLQPALEVAGARLEISIAESLPNVRFDRDAVAQIIQNLLDNAEKHTRHAADRTIELALCPGPGGVELSVTDRGPGLPVEVRRHLFEAFRRGNEEDAPAGLGLGLVLVKALADAQGATVTYESRQGGGAKFNVQFA